MNNHIKTKISLLLMLFLISVSGNLLAQNTALENTTLGQCYHWTKENYPLVKQLDLINKTTEYNLSNASKGFLPQINLNGQASYQSDVTELPIALPNMEIPPVSKDQYKIYADIYMPLTNFHSIQTSKLLHENEGEIAKQNIEVELYKLKERVNQLFFGILLIDKKTELLKLILEDLDSALVRIHAAELNGIATSSDADVIKVEKLSIHQKIIEGESNKKAFTTMLAMLTGKNITSETQLTAPSPTISPNMRPELRLFDLKINSLSIVEKQITNRLLPNLGLFLQAGYGRPALNFLNNDFATYYIGGLRLNWNISNLYTSKTSKQNLALASQQISNQRKTFQLNTDLTAQQQNAEVSKFLALMEKDEEIIQLRKSIKEASAIKLENGIISSLDFVKYVNDLSRARQDLALHETQLLLSKCNLKNTKGN